MIRDFWFITLLSFVIFRVKKSHFQTVFNNFWHHSKSWRDRHANENKYRTFIVGCHSFRAELEHHHEKYYSKEKRIKMKTTKKWKIAEKNNHNKGAACPFAFLSSYCLIENTWTMSMKKFFFPDRMAEKKRKGESNKYEAKGEETKLKENIQLYGRCRNVSFVSTVGLCHDIIIFADFFLYFFCSRNSSQMKNRSRKKNSAANFTSRPYPFSTWRVFRFSFHIIFFFIFIFIRWDFKSVWKAYNNLNPPILKMWRRRTDTVIHCWV